MDDDQMKSLMERYSNNRSSNSTLTDTSSICTREKDTHMDLGFTKGESELYPTEKPTARTRNEDETLKRQLEEQQRRIQQLNQELEKLRQQNMILSKEKQQIKMDVRDINNDRNALKTELVKMREKYERLMKEKDYEKDEIKCLQDNSDTFTQYQKEVNLVAEKINSDKGCLQKQFTDRYRLFRQLINEYKMVQNQIFDEEFGILQKNQQ